MKKNVLISVWNKEKIVETAIELLKYGYEIIATSSVANILKENGINTEKIINENTLIPEDIYKDLTAETPDIKIVLSNYSPINQYLNKDDSAIELINKIDINADFLEKISAKNYKNICTITSINDYNELLNNIKENNGTTSLEFREKTALKVFQRSVIQSSEILEELSQKLSSDINNTPQYISLNMEKIKELPFGENKQQNASIYSNNSLISYEIINKEPSYSNYIDISLATSLISEFYDVCCCAIVKHNAPCGVALGKSIGEAYLKALDCNPLSSIGSIFAFSQTINEALAKQLIQNAQDVIIAPEYTLKALDILKSKSNLCIIKLNTPLSEYKNYSDKEIKITPFGTLIQETDKGELNKDNFKITTKEKPTTEIIEDMIFAWKIVKHSKSIAVVVVKDFKTIGISTGETNRIDAVESALNKACDGSKDAVLASDGAITTIENILSSVQGRIKAIIQPGGSTKDENITNIANKYNISMITTGISHIKH